jgi:hypothetical protein
VRLLLVFLAACGSSSTFTNASPLETTTQEPELASAPIVEPDADAAAANAPSCYCPTVTIRCGSGGAFHARADRATCTLDLPLAACRLFAFEDGALAEPERILATEAPAALSADDVFELCSAKHEAYHACDRAMGGRLCAFELPAYDVTLECMRGFATDPKVAHNIEGVLAAREMNACLCTENSCAACSARCRSEHPAFESTCEQAQTVYCQ